MAYMRDVTGRRLDSLTVVASTVRRTAEVLSTAGSGGIATESWGSANIRHAVRLPVPTSRWRVRLSNSDVKAVHDGVAGHSFRGAWIGAHSFGITDGTGNFKAAPVAAIADPGVGVAPIPADGTYWTSGWVTDPAAQIPAGQNYLLSLQTVAPSAITTSVSYSSCWTLATTTDGGTTAPNPNVSAHSPFDIIIEYEFVDDGSHGVGLYIGDSITEGQASVSTPNTVIGFAWPAQYGLRSRRSSVNAAIGGDKSTDWTTLTSRRWTRLDIAGYAPDFAFVAFGTNDGNSNVSIATFQTSMQTIINHLRDDLGIKKIYLATVPPRGKTGVVALNNAVIGVLTASSAVGATTISSTVTVTNGISIILSQGLAAEERVTVSGSSGTGPYTLTISATVFAHASGDIVIDNNEYKRQQYNAWLTTLPLGVSGLVDVDRIVRDPSRLYSMPPDLTNEGTHLTRLGYALIAAAVPTRP